MAVPLIPIAMALAQFAPGNHQVAHRQRQGGGGCFAGGGHRSNRDRDLRTRSSLGRDPGQPKQGAGIPASDEQVDLEKAYLADVASAREMQIAGHSPVPAILSYLVAVGYLARWQA